MKQWNHFVLHSTLCIRNLGRAQWRDIHWGCGHLKALLGWLVQMVCSHSLSLMVDLKLSQSCRPEYLHMGSPAEQPQWSQTSYLVTGFPRVSSQENLMVFYGLALEMIQHQFCHTLLIKAVTSPQGKGTQTLPLNGSNAKEVGNFKKNHHRREANKLCVIHPVGTVLQLELSSSGGRLGTEYKTSQNCPQGRQRKLKYLTSNFLLVIFQGQEVWGGNNKSPRNRWAFPQY